jgi:hypothetical protein
LSAAGTADRAEALAGNEKAPNPTLATRREVSPIKSRLEYRPMIVIDN